MIPAPRVRSFLATRHHAKKQKKHLKAKAKAKAATEKVVWTMETDRGEVYAVFFDETLKSQVPPQSSTLRTFYHSSKMTYQFGALRPGRIG